MSISSMMGAAFSAMLDIDWPSYTLYTDLGKRKI